MKITKPVNLRPFLVTQHIWTQRKINRLIWSMKQLLPLSYWTKYRTQDGAQHFAIWRMWFGRCYDITTVIVP